VPGLLQSACVNCAHTKTKCDRHFPCQRCRVRGTTCVPRIRGNDVSFDQTRYGLESNYQASSSHAQGSEETFRTGDTQRNLASINNSCSGGGVGSGHAFQRQESGRPATAGMPQLPLTGFLSRPSLSNDHPQIMHLDHAQDLSSTSGQVLTHSVMSDGVHPQQALQMAPSDANTQEQQRMAPPTIIEDPPTFSNADWSWDMIFASHVGTPQNHIPIPNGIRSDGASTASTRGPNAGTPARSVENLVRLGDNFTDDAPWSLVSETWRTENFSEGELIDNLPLAEATRDRVLATTQGFFRLALDSLSVSSNPGSRHLVTDLKKFSSSSILLLPPTSVLHQYIEAFLTSFEPCYPLVSGRSLNPNEIISDKHEQITVLLLLSMIALGALKDTSLKARRLSMGLLEIYRVALLHLVDKDITNPRSNATTHCALLSTYQAAFSGVKWLMDSSPSQVYQYIFMAKHSLLFEKHPHLSTSLIRDDVDALWKIWLDREYSSRLAYSWVMVDLEVSLFYDSNPTLAISDLQRSLPDNDDLWFARDASSWRACWTKHYEADLQSSTPLENCLPSLPQLFTSLLENKVDHVRYRLQIAHMRLLLYPIHVLVVQLNESLLYLPRNNARSRMPVNFVSSHLQLREAKDMLHVWVQIFDALEATTTRQTALKQLTEVLYHLVGLNVAVNFPSVESLVSDNRINVKDRGEGLKGAIRAPRDAILHCGQILRILITLQPELRPLWWAAAVYRAAVVLLCVGEMDIDADSDIVHATSTTTVDFDLQIDKLCRNSPHWQQYQKYGVGRPCLTAEDGQTVPLNHRQAVYRICRSVLEHSETTSPLAEKFLQKIDTLSMG
jgi:hypothetical protein